MTFIRSAPLSQRTPRAPTRPLASKELVSVDNTYTDVADGRGSSATSEVLRLDEDIRRLRERKQMLLLSTGPSGSGKPHIVEVRILSHESQVSLANLGKSDMIPTTTEDEGFHTVESKRSRCRNVKKKTIGKEVRAVSGTSGRSMGGQLDGPSSSSGRSAAPKAQPKTPGSRTIRSAAIVVKGNTAGFDYAAALRQARREISIIEMGIETS